MNKIQRESLMLMTKNELYVYNDKRPVDSYKTENMNYFVFDKSLFIIASESQNNMQIIFNPKINEAPVWCTSIDNFTNDFDDFVIIENNFVITYSLTRHIDDVNLKFTIAYQIINRIFFFFTNVEK